MHELHGAVRREKAEPRAGREALSVWLLGLYALTIFFGGFYLARYAGDFSGSSLDPTTGPPLARRSSSFEPAPETVQLSPAARGKKIFLANCATCHQASGAGVAGQYPPLAGSEYVTGGTRRLGMIVLKGLQGPLIVKGAQYGSAVMQPWEQTLNDGKIADVLTYIRSDWGNNAPPVTAEAIAALRRELVGRTNSFTQADLEAVPADANLPGETDAAEARASSPAVVVVNIRNMKFDPASVEVRKGDVVEWKNEDITPHTATSSGFDSGPIDPDKSWRHPFTESGSFSYTCTFHPDMKAVVVVK